MNEDESFQEVLRGLKALGSKRDPRSVRLAAVTMAIIDVINEDEITPAKVYASTVTTLEGSLQQSDNLGSNSLITQVALLEVLRVSIPYVARNTLSATLPITSRVLRAVVISCCNIIHDDDTKDELGGVNATLRASCRATTQLVIIMASDAQEKVVRQLLQDTLILLWDDRRSNVRKAAQEGANEIVLNGLCGSLFTNFSSNRINSNNTTKMLQTLRWLQTTILHLQFERLGQKIMQVLLSIIEQPSGAGSDFVANFGKRQARDRVLLINEILTLLVFVMEEQEIQLEKSRKDQIHTFATRVLATLLQGKPLLIFLSEKTIDAELLENGKVLYGKVLMLSCQFVMKSDPTVVKKLLPLTVQQVVQLSKPELDESSVVAKFLMPELTRMFRTIDVTNELLHIMEVILHHSFRATWSVSLLPLATLLRRNQNPDVIAQLIQLHPLDEKPVEEAIGSIIQEVGLEKFWKFISWNNDVNKSLIEKKHEIINFNQAWLLPVLKTFGSLSAVRPDMLFFQTSVMSLARECDKTAVQHKKEPDKSYVVDLWALFECFCSGIPKDFPKVFPELVPTLVRAMGDERYPKLVTIICRGLKSLAESNQDKLTRQVFLKASTTLLPALFKLVEIMQENSSSNRKNENYMDLDDNKTLEEKAVNIADQRVCVVISAISKLACTAPSVYLQSLLKKILQRLLTASQSTQNECEKICTLLSLSQALVPALENTSLELVYRTVKPLIRSDEQPPRVQKRAYKVLLAICQLHPAFCTKSDRLLFELTNLLIDSIMTCQVSARHLRLKCMAIVVKEFKSTDKQQMDIIPKIVGEVLLCLKDSNEKTREAAYQLLLSMAKVMDSMESYLKIIAAALGALTPHMRSAAVMALSRLVFEYAREDVMFQKMIPSMLQTVLVLFDETSREVTKSVIGFVRICVAAMTYEQLEPLLPEIIGGLFKYHKVKDRFRAKIKIILKKLVFIYGYEKIIPHVPDNDARLLTHMRKLSERAVRRKKAQRVDRKSKIIGFDGMMESDEEDSDNNRTLMTGATRFTQLTYQSGKGIQNATMERCGKETMNMKKNSTVITSCSKPEGARLKNEKDGNVVDLLNPSKNVHFAVEEDSENDSDSCIMEFDELGRLIISDNLEDDSKREQVMVDRIKTGENNDSVIFKKPKITRFESAKLASGQGRKKNVKALGAAYKSKKSGGDVKKRRHRFEPYAFVPLDGKDYTKNNRKKTVQSMATVVRGRGKRKR
mmetsp:Transcript_40077/g.45606  ORF Transcript_40077/g.45606 Transcript_40077/m.45606 type:complete len:1234 (-) Transcript_40077:9-3710(-)